jgi:hypothetical protein
MFTRVDPRPPWIVVVYFGAMGREGSDASRTAR